jgi:hypothetical protein
LYEIDKNKKTVRYYFLVPGHDDIKDGYLKFESLATIEERPI